LLISVVNQHITALSCNLYLSVYKLWTLSNGSHSRSTANRWLLQPVVQISVLCLCAIWYPQCVYQQDEVCGWEREPTLWSLGVG
jgi:hypothetical protein